MKKILILGSAGMLGHMVYYYLKSLGKYEIIDSSFSEKLHEGSILLDVRDDEKLNELIISEQPDVVINCIGILIKGSQTDPSNAIYLNAYLPHRLAKILRKTGGRLIHISTDCVFSGKKGDYAENDFRDADDIYGRSKTLGEVNNEIDTTLRTSIIGPELKEKGEGLFHWFMEQTNDVNGYKNSFWSGVTTLQLAKVIEHVIENKLCGLMHVTSGLKITKFELLQLFNTIWDKKLRIKPVEVKPVDKSLQQSDKLKMEIPDYSTMLEEQKHWMQDSKQLYGIYEN